MESRAATSAAAARLSCLLVAQVRAVGGGAELSASSAGLRDAVLAGLAAAREVAAVKGRGASWQSWTKSSGHFAPWRQRT